MATYQDIREYVRKKHDRTVKSCWIAHVKELNGLPLRVSARRYDVQLRTNPCPADKREWIEDALRHFGEL